VPVRRWRGRLIALIAGAGAVAAAVAVFTGGYLVGNHVDRTDLQAGMRASMRHRAAEVMPFDLNVTTHTFTKISQGGVQQVVANSGSDRADIDLIRGHLRQLASRFANGEFSDPATIHGADMPGLTALEAAGGRLTVTYAEIPRGATITYTSTDQDLINTIHTWFDAQTHDHSMPGMGG
jgi:hypothetical protein